MRRAIFPGSFDPITLGHQDIIERSISLFDEIIIAVGTNSDKKYMFNLTQRMKFIADTFKGKKSISVTSYEGLTIEFCKQSDANFIIRGLRNPADFEFEKSIALTNRKMTDIETIFFLTSPENSFISSSIVRDLIRNNGDYKLFIPKGITF